MRQSVNKHICVPEARHYLSDDEIYHYAAIRLPNRAKSILATVKFGEAHKYFYLRKLLLIIFQKKLSFPHFLPQLLPP